MAIRTAPAYNAAVRGIGGFGGAEGATVNPGDLFRFVLALGLLPVMLRIGRSIRIPVGRRAFVIGVAAIIIGFGMQVVGPFIPWRDLRYVRHFVFAIGGFGLAAAAWQARVYELTRGGDDG